MDKHGANNHWGLFKGAELCLDFSTNLLAPTTTTTTNLTNSSESGEAQQLLMAPKRYNERASRQKFASTAKPDLERAQSGSWHAALFFLSF